MAATPKPVPESARALGAGLTFAVVVALFTLGGLWLDRELGTSPWFVLVGVFLGLVGGTIHLVATLSPRSLPFGRKPPARRPPSDEPPAPDSP